MFSVSLNNYCKNAINDNQSFHSKHFPLAFKRIKYSKIVHVELFSGLQTLQHVLCTYQCQAGGGGGGEAGHRAGF